MAYPINPDRADIVEAKVQNLIDFLNNDERFRMDLLLKMAISHFLFEAIHLFRDGNGGTGRIFNIHFLTKKRALDYPIFFMSRYIMEHKEDYYTG